MGFIQQILLTQGFIIVFPIEEAKIPPAPADVAPICEELLFAKASIQKMLLQFKPLLYKIFGGQKTTILRLNMVHRQYKEPCLNCSKPRLLTQITLQSPLPSPVTTNTLCGCRGAEICGTLATAGARCHTAAISNRKERYFCPGSNRDSRHVLH